MSLITAEMRQNIILRALSDPVFLRQLREQPASALGVREINPDTLADINKILSEIETAKRAGTPYVDGRTNLKQY